MRRKAQEQFSLGAESMSQGSGSPVNFLDTAACDDILQDIRVPDCKLPDFGSIRSEPGSPPPALELEVTHGERGTQTSPAPTQDRATTVLIVSARTTSDQATQVLSRPHQGTSSTQTPASASTSDQTTQVLLRPPSSVAYTLTATEAKSTRTS